MKHFGEQLVAILTAIIGVAIIAVLVSNRSNTSNVISSAANAFASILKVAVSPISGGGGVSNMGFTGSVSAASPLDLSSLQIAPPTYATGGGAPNPNTALGSEQIGLGVVNGFIQNPSSLAALAALF